jgi:hypothetical protein
MAYSTCALAPSAAAARPIGLAKYRSASLLLPLTPQLRLPAHPLGNTAIPPHRFPAPPTTTIETEQNPLKIDPRAKV